MDKLLSPEFGLSFWTLVVFGLLVVVLTKTTWKPMITALEERETNLKAERDAAEAARKAAEALKASLETELAGLAAKAAAALAQAQKDGQKTKDDILKAAQEEAKTLLEKNRRQLEDDKDRLVRELRSQVSEISVLAAAKIMKSTMDAATQKRLLDDFFKDLEKSKAN